MDSVGIISAQDIIDLAALTHPYITREEEDVSHHSGEYGTHYSLSTPAVYNTQALEQSSLKCDFYHGYHPSTAATTIVY